MNSSEDTAPNPNQPEREAPAPGAPAEDAWDPRKLEVTRRGAGPGAMHAPSDPPLDNLTLPQDIAATIRHKPAPDEIQAEPAEVPVPPPTPEQPEPEPANAPHGGPADLEGDEFIPPTIKGNAVAAPQPATLEQGTAGDGEEWEVDLDLGMTRRGAPDTTGPAEPKPVADAAAKPGAAPDAIDFGVTAAHTVRRRVVEQDVDIDLDATLRGRGGLIPRKEEAPTEDVAEETRATPGGAVPPAAADAAAGYDTGSALDLAMTQRHVPGSGGDGEDDALLGETRRGDWAEAGAGAAGGGTAMNLEDTRRSAQRAVAAEDAGGSMVTQTLPGLTYRFEIPEQDLPQADPQALEDPALKTLLAWKERRRTVATVLAVLALLLGLLAVFLRYGDPAARLAERMEQRRQALAGVDGHNAVAAAWQNQLPLWRYQQELLRDSLKLRQEIEMVELRLMEEEKELREATEKLAFLQQYGDLRTGQNQLETGLTASKASLAALQERRDLLEEIRQRITRLPPEQLERFKFADFTERALMDSQQVQVPLPAGAQPLEMVWLPPVGGRGGFWVSRYEVTWEQYLAVMGTRNSGAPITRREGANLPAEGIWWTDAKRFCTTLNRLAAQSPAVAAGYEYRLPTFAEWRQYAGERSGGVYGRSKAAPVGSGGRNSLGLADVYGNVAEWLEDRANSRVMQPDLQVNLGFWEREPTAAGGRYLEDGPGHPASKVMTVSSTEYTEFKRGGFGFRVVLAKK